VCMSAATAHTDTQPRPRIPRSCWKWPITVHNMHPVYASSTDHGQGLLAWVSLLQHGYPRALRHEPHRGTTAQLANWLQDPKLPIAEPTPGISGRLGLKAAPFAWTCLVRLWSQAAEALLGLNRRTTPAACSGRRAFPCLVPSPRNRQRPAEAAARPCPAEPAPELWHRA